MWVWPLVPEVVRRARADHRFDHFSIIDHLALPALPPDFFSSSPRMPICASRGAPPTLAAAGRPLHAAPLPPHGLPDALPAPLITATLAAAARPPGGGRSSSLSSSSGPSRAETASSPNASDTSGTSSSRTDEVNGCSAAIHAS